MTGYIFEEETTTGRLIGRCRSDCLSMDPAASQDFRSGIAMTTGSMASDDGSVVIDDATDEADVGGMGTERVEAATN